MSRLSRPSLLLAERQIAFSVVLLGLLMPTIAIADLSPPSGPATSTSGNYTVLYPVDEETRECDYIFLEERVVGSSGWVSVPDPGYDGVVHFTNKASGQYQYRAHAVCEDYYAERGWDMYSDAITIQVYVESGELPTPGSTEDQLHYSYEVRSGDINSDGYTDVFVTRTSGGQPLDGSIDDVILLGAALGQFSVLVPTNAQTSIANSWPLANIDIRLDDFNADGFLDLMLAGVSDTIAGAFDQILYAPGEVFSAVPLGVRSLSPDFLEFIDDVHQFSLDNNYFNDNEEIVEEGYWDYEIECELIWWGDFPEWICNYYPVWVEYEYVTYPGIDPNAVDIWEAWQELLDGSGSYGSIVTEFESQLGVEIGNGVLCDHEDIDGNEIPGEDECDAISISAAIEAIRRQTQRLHQMEEYYGRVPGYVYITGHRVFPKREPVHLAVEYRDPVTLQAEWVSSGPKVGFSPTGLVLVSEDGRTSDDPPMNHTVAAASSAVGLGAAEYFRLVQTTEMLYRTNNGCLTYWFYPENTARVDYNSNGFVSGIIDATLGIADFSASTYSGFGDFPGGSTPVPASEFTSSPPGCD